MNKWHYSMCHLSAVKGLRCTKASCNSFYVGRLGCISLYECGGSGRQGPLDMFCWKLIRLKWFHFLKKFCLFYLVRRLRGASSKLNPFHTACCYDNAHIVVCSNLAITNLYLAFLREILKHLLTWQFLTITRKTLYSLILCWSFLQDFQEILKKCSISTFRIVMTYVAVFNHIEEDLVFCKFISRPGLTTQQCMVGYLILLITSLPT